MLLVIGRAFLYQLYGPSRDAIVSRKTPNGLILYNMF